MQSRGVSPFSTGSSAHDHYLQPNFDYEQRLPSRRSSLRPDSLASNERRESLPKLDDLRYIDDIVEDEDALEDGFEPLSSQRSFGSVLVDHDKLTARCHKRRNKNKMAKLGNWLSSKLG